MSPRAYYYLMATLPELGFDRAPPISSQDFLERCAEHLPARSYGLLAETGLSEGPAAVRARLVVHGIWYPWERTLRQELARLRARRLDGELARSELPSGPEAPPAGAAEVAMRVMRLDSPRGAEDELDRARWDFLERLEFGRYFTLERLVVYLLKLRILERRAVFDATRGRERLRVFTARSRATARAAIAAVPG